jgi:Xaa-Pro aminopeptidase
MSGYSLIELDWPTTATLEPAPRLEAPLLLARIEALRERMDREGYEVALIYADREHFANLHYFTNFDPRFEEALLVVNTEQDPVLLVGNECQAYLPISPLWREKRLRMELYRPFSLEDQTRTIERSLAEILSAEGCQPGAKVALIGTKTYARPQQSDVPSYIVDTVRELVGREQCVNCTGWVVNAQDGLRSTVSAADIVIFEQNNVKAGEAIRRMYFTMQPGMTDHELLAASVAYDGTPLSCHMTCKTGPNRVSLASASGNRIEVGHTWSANVAYWGANVCRASWIARGPEDVPAAAQDYVEAFAGPYFLAMAGWLERIGVGADCGEIHHWTLEQLPHEMFRVELNPGHLIGYDEWPAAPFHAGSKVKLRSGMVLQSDVIPGNKVYFSSRMEEGYALADEALRTEIATRYPASWARMMARREFLATQVGIQLDESVLPLANTAGLIAPWALEARRVFRKDR